MANTPLKRIRVDDDLWREFGLAAEASGTDRTKAMLGFMRRYVEAFRPTRTMEVDQGQVRSDSSA